MKDWRKSPEPISMMGASGSGYNDGSSYGSTNVFDHQPPPPSSSSSSSLLMHKVQHDQVLPPLYPPHKNDNSRTANQSESFQTRSKMDISLGEMARRMITQNIHLFESFGQAPFPIVKPILQQCSASKLWSLEEESPEYINHTSEIWKGHCLRDFKDVQKLYTSHPSNVYKLVNFTSWRELYHSKVVEKFEAMEAAKQRMKERFAALKANKEAGQVRIVAETPVMRSRNNHAHSSSSYVKPLGLQSTQGQKMLHKARVQANTVARCTTQSPIRKGSIGSKVRLMPSIQIKDNTTAKSATGVASPPAVQLSSTQSSSPGSLPGKGPPGFERKATFYEAEKLGREAVEQFSRALMERSGQKRSSENSDSTSKKTFKSMPDKNSTGSATNKTEISKHSQVVSPSSHRSGSTGGVHVRTKQVHSPKFRSG